MACMSIYNRYSDDDDDGEYDFVSSHNACVRSSSYKLPVRVVKLRSRIPKLRDGPFLTRDGHFVWLAGTEGVGTIYRFHPCVRAAKMVATVNYHSNRLFCGDGFLTDNFNFRYNVNTEELITGGLPSEKRVRSRQSFFHISRPAQYHTSGDDWRPVGLPNLFETEFVGEKSGAYFFYIQQEGLYMLPVAQAKDNFLLTTVDAMETAGVPLDLAALVASSAGIRGGDEHRRRSLHWLKIVTGEDVRRIRALATNEDNRYVRLVTSFYELRDKTAEEREALKRMEFETHAELIYSRDQKNAVALEEEIKMAQDKLDRIRREMPGTRVRAEHAKKKRLEAMSEAKRMLPVRIAELESEFERVKTECDASELVPEMGQTKTPRRKRRRSSKSGATKTKKMDEEEDEEKDEEKDEEDAAAIGKRRRVPESKSSSSGSSSSSAGSSGSGSIASGSGSSSTTLQ